MTPYEILEVSEDADDDAIKQAYLRQIRAYPPEHAPRRFQRIRDAYQQIQTLEQRLAFELFHAREPSQQELLDHLRQSTSAPQRPPLDAMRSALAAALRARS